MVIEDKIKQRVEELMKEGKESPIRGWSARQIQKQIQTEFKNESLGELAFRYIKSLYGHKNTPSKRLKELNK